MSTRSARQFIDDCAEVDHGMTGSEDEAMDDPNSTEVQIRSADVRDYDMADVREDNEARWHARAPYQLPPIILPDESCAANAYALPPIRTAFPTFNLPLDDAPVPARHRTPLFYQKPATLHCLQRASPSAQTVASTSSMFWTPHDDGDVASPSSMFWSSDDGDDGNVASTSSMFWKPSDDGDTAPPTASSFAADNSTSSSSTSLPSTFKEASPAPCQRRVVNEARLQRINAYLDTMASDSDSDGQDSEDDMAVDVPDDDDIAFIKDDSSKSDEETPHMMLPQDNDAADLQEIADHYERAAKDYKESSATDMDNAPRRNIWAWAKNPDKGLPEDPVLCQNIKAMLPIPHPFTPTPSPLPTTEEGKKKKKTNKVAKPEDLLTPGSWVRLRAPYKDRLAFVVGRNKCIATLADWDSGARFDDRNNRWEFLKNVKPAFRQRTYKVVTPTLEDVQPFGSCCRHELLHMSFSSPALALDVGDRVVCRRRWYAGQEGYLLDWGIYETEGHAYAMAKIIHTPIAAGPYTRRMKGFWMHRSDLRRHVLCPSPAVRIHDCVTVTTGKEFRGYVGWVTNIKGHIVTMSRCQAPPESEPEETPVTITIEMEFITRDIRKGDLVTVGTAYHSSADHEEEVAAKIFLVNRADVNFLLADDILKPSAPYTAHSHVPHPAVPIPHPAFQPENALLRREEDWESYDADALAQASVFDKILEIAPPTSLASLAAGLDKINDKQQSLLHVGKRYERIFVKVIGSKHGVSVHKGRWGMVEGDYNSKERSERLKLQNLKKRWNTQGIMVTIRDATNRQFHVEIEMVMHEA
ncbi:hypothetical protein FB451DRAFT_1413807 [Mycena latifolia]|nr:hypothetical protein FB451DRAFT_1413807 [Mycena latifolia]